MGATGQSSGLTTDRRKHLTEVFLNQIYSIPGGTRINRCLQCGTCSGTCPVSPQMDYSPREIFAALRAEMLDRVIGSNCMWMCTSCYNCVVRCPAKIPITDIMYELKRLSVMYDLHPRNVAAPTMTKTFVEQVAKYGRNPEAKLITLFYLRTRQLGSMLANIGRAIGMYKRGRLSFRAKRISGLRQFQELLAKAETADLTRRTYSVYGDMEAVKLKTEGGA